jgi:hypothetical protein
MSNPPSPEEIPKHLAGIHGSATTHATILPSVTQTDVPFATSSQHVSSSSPHSANAESAVKSLVKDNIRHTAEGEENFDQTEGRKQTANDEEAQSALDDLAKSMREHLRCVVVHDAVSDKYTQAKYNDLGWTVEECMAAEKHARSAWMKANKRETAAP